MISDCYVYFYLLVGAYRVGSSRNTYYLSSVIYESTTPVFLVFSPVLGGDPVVRGLQDFVIVGVMCVHGDDQPPDSAGNMRGK